MKTNLPRVLVGASLLLLAVVFFIVGVANTTGTPSVARFLVAMTAAFVGTQMVLGRRVPGMRRGSGSVR